MMDFLINGGGIWVGVGENCFCMCIRGVDGYVSNIEGGIFWLGSMNLFWFLSIWGCKGCVVGNCVLFDGIWFMVDLLVVNFVSWERLFVVRNFGE